MSQAYTKHDLDLVNGGQLLVRISPNPNTGVGGFPTPNSTVATDIKFQFPPKVKNDSRSGSWKENSTGMTGHDPIGFYEFGKPRQVTMEWSYVVDGNDWRAVDIQRQLVPLRRYFANRSGGITTGFGANGLFGSLAVHLLIWGMGGVNPASFRFDSISIKHGETMVGKGYNAFPLRTDITAELRSWPVVFGVQVTPAQIALTPEWY